MGLFDKLGSGVKGASSGAAKNSALKGLFGGTATAGSKVVSGAAGAVSAAGTAVQGAAWAAGKSIFESFEDPGYILFVAGMLTFFIPTFENPLLTKVIALGLMFFSAFFVLGGKAIFTTTIFFVWYIYLNAPTDINTIIVKGFLSLAVIFALGMLAHGLFSKFSKSRGESFGEGMMGELTAFIPIGLFLLHVGLVEYLITYYNLTLTNTVKILLYCIPWWALLGAFTAKNKNTFVKISQVILIIYLVGVIAYSLPKAYGQESNLAGVDQLLQARQQASQTTAQPKAYQLFLFQVQCYTSYTTGEDPQSCVERKQEDYEFNYYCTEIAQTEAETSAYEQCIKEQKEKKEKEKIKVSGISDPTIKKPTRGELVTDQFFPRELTVPANEPFRMKYPIELKISNPREQNFLVELKCNFTKVGSTPENSDSFMGVVSGGVPQRLSAEATSLSGTEANTFFVEGENPSQSFYCVPPFDKQLNGSYRLTYTADFSGLKTTSRLGRAFIGTKDSEWKKEWLNKIIEAHFPSRTYLSQGPEDFARMNFGFGHSANYPLIEDGKSILLYSMIENIGQGEITKVNQYQIHLDSFGVSPDTSCLEGQNYPVPDSKYGRKDIYLPSCSIVSLPLEFTNPEMYVYHEFEGEIDYNYRIKKEENIRVVLS